MLLINKSITSNDQVAANFQILTLYPKYVQTIMGSNCFVPKSVCVLYCVLERDFYSPNIAVLSETHAIPATMLFP